MLRAMVRMNPQLNELMEQRPEIARMLEDPELLQQSLRHAEPRGGLLLLLFFLVGAGMRIQHQFLIRYVDNLSVWYFRWIRWWL